MSLKYEDFNKDSPFSTLNNLKYIYKINQLQRIRKVEFSNPDCKLSFEQQLFHNYTKIDTSIVLTR